jgi:hypothetical protein
MWGVQMTEQFSPVAIGGGSLPVSSLHSEISDLTDNTRSVMAQEQQVSVHEDSDKGLEGEDDGEEVYA